MLKLISELEEKIYPVTKKDIKRFNSYKDIIQCMKIFGVDFSNLHIKIDMQSKIPLNIVFEKTKDMGDYSFKMNISFGSIDLFKTINTNVILTSAYKNDISTESFNYVYDYDDFTKLMNIMTGEFGNSFTTLFNLCNESKNNEKDIEN